VLMVVSNCISILARSRLNQSIRPTRFPSMGWCGAVPMPAKKKLRTEHGPFSGCFHKISASGDKLGLHMGQQINFGSSTSKQGTLWAGLRTRGHSTSSYLCPCIIPLSMPLHHTFFLFFGRGGLYTARARAQPPPPPPRLGHTFFRKWGRGVGRGPGVSPAPPHPTHPLAHRGACLAAQGGKGELCTALSTATGLEPLFFRFSHFFTFRRPTSIYTQYPMPMPNGEWPQGILGSCMCIPM
jgi:hypothetical protein